MQADVDFLRQHSDVILLSSDDGQAQVALVPAFQGRVMTSTTGGSDGPSFGWINRQAIASGERQPHINAIGGEDRFWLGPEGGQYSIYFKPNDPFDLEHWQVPEPIDWGPWEVLSAASDEARFRKAMELVNYSGTRLQLDVDRSVRLLEASEQEAKLGVSLGAGVGSVAYESINTIANRGTEPWRKETGLLSVWILGMFDASPSTTVVIPFRPGPESELGPVVNDAYFGKVPGERLTVGDAVLYFRGDARHRSKIGISRARALPVMGSYDPFARALTLVQYTLPSEAADYVNSMWEIQEEPYRGDVVNSYNDGPPAPGAPQLGAFYELETSSPAAALAPGESLTHVHRTFHISGPEEELDRIARHLLQVSLEEVKAAFGRSASPAP